jgi:hypothetical protein
MASPYPSRRLHAGGARFPALLVLLVLAAGGVLAYRTFFHRAGEAAIQLIPADAMLVATLDTTPSPQQVALFKRIDDAVQREKVDTHIDKLVTSSLTNSNLGKEIRPQLKNSFALALFRAAGAGRANEPDGVALLAIKSPGKMLDILARYGQRQAQGEMEYFQLPKEKMAATVISEYLVLSDKPDSLARIFSVYRRETPSVTTLDEYKQARESLPADANLMLFVSPRGMAQLAQTGEKQQVVRLAPLKKARWLAAGMTARDRGLETVWRMPMEGGQTVPPPVAALDNDLLKRLPAGPYGLMAFSQPGRYWDWVSATASTDSTARKTLDAGLDSFEKETGLSVPRDIVPGLTGDLVLAVYPNADGNRSAVDGLMVVNDANGADPAALAEKIRASVESHSAKDGHSSIHFLESRRDGITIWTLDEAGQKQIGHSASSLTGAPGVSAGPVTVSPSLSHPPGAVNRHSLEPSVQFGGIGVHSDGTDVQVDDHGMHVQADGTNVRVDERGMHVQGNGVNLDADNNGFHAQGSGASVDAGGNGVRVQGGGAQVSVGTPPPPAKKPGDPWSKKTVTFAQVGKTILLASTPQMLDRAIDAFTNNTGALSSDPFYAHVETTLPAGTQNALLINLPSILQALRPFLADMMKGGTSDLTVDDITGLFGPTSSGIVASQRYDGKTMIATFFLPLDYERLIHMIGVASKNTTPRATPPDRDRALGRGYENLDTRWKGRGKRTRVYCSPIRCCFGIGLFLLFPLPSSLFPCLRGVRGLKKRGQKYEQLCVQHGRRLGQHDPVQQRHGSHGRAALRRTARRPRRLRRSRPRRSRGWG